MSEVTVVLSGFQRPHRLQEQINAIRGQSLQPTETMLWTNQGTMPFEASLVAQTNAATCNQNHGVWGRFAFALLAKTRYVAVFDDDTIPGRRWLENCVSTVRQVQGLLGTRGLRFHDAGDYFGNSECRGLYRPSSWIERVDIVGHCWFFEREWLGTAFWRELPDLRIHGRVGEDMHFSYAVQKYLGLNTYVPPHPRNKPDFWGSIRPEYGVDENSIFCADGPDPMREYLQLLRAKGFRLMCEDPGIATSLQSAGLDPTRIRRPLKSSHAE